MAGKYLDVYYEPDSIHSTQGAMWIVLSSLTGGRLSGQLRLSHDCGSIGEIEHVIAGMEADLNRIRRRAKAMFLAQSQKPKA